MESLWKFGTLGVQINSTKGWSRLGLSCGGFVGTRIILFNLQVGISVIGIREAISELI